MVFRVINKRWMLISIIAFGCLLGALVFGLAFYISDTLFNPNRHLENSNSMILNLQSSTSLSSGKLEEAGVSVLAAKARFQIDRKVFPPIETGGSAPGVLFAAFSSVNDQPIIEELAKEPEVFIKVIQRMEKWQPKFPYGYNPGWKFQKELGAEEKVKVVDEVRSEMLLGLSRQYSLLTNQKYRKLLVDLVESRKEEDRISRLQKKHNDARRKNGQKYDWSYLSKEALAEFRRKRTILGDIKHLEWEIVPALRWHAKVGWNATDFFDDKDVVKLCKAIERNDLEEIRKLIAEGVNLNSLGKGNMTPLLWAYPDRKFERFRLLVEAGADPNVVPVSDFGVGGRDMHAVPGVYFGYLDIRFIKGISINQLVCNARDNRYFFSVMKNGGDPNQTTAGCKSSPIVLVLEMHRDGPEKLKTLLENGAKVNPKGGSPLIEAINRESFWAVKQLAEAGADPNKKFDRFGNTPAMRFLKKVERFKNPSPEKARQIALAKKALEKNGANFGDSKN